ncbi:MAG: sulfatase-like hydrolase/transferase [Halioglobus sp.]|nr:sulfatase-like hydrolase/transferase [Halioglobus sp.]
MSNVTRSFRSLCLALCLAALAVPADAQPTGRNILFISIDDLRNWTGYNGEYGGTIHTPNIDALANVSTRFTNAYASVPFCLGSRTTVVTGLSPATHQVGVSPSLVGVGSPQYNAIYNNPAIKTLPEVMSDNGYYSAVAGKVFHKQIPAKWDEAGPPIDLSPFFNAFDPGPDGTFFKPEVLAPGIEHPDQTVANWAENFIDTYSGQDPFFLAVGFYQPHVPWRVPQWAYDLYPLGSVVAHTPTPGDMDDEPQDAVDIVSNLLPTSGLPVHETIVLAGKTIEYTQAYLASISHTDAMIGQVMLALQNSTFAANTDVVLWSDHGFHLGEKFHWRKLTFWEPSVRVPLLISSPGNSNYPIVNETRAVNLLDLAPTVLDLAGLPPFSQFEGAPLHDAVNASPVEIYARDGRATVIGGQKFVDYDFSQPSVYNIATYDLTTDPGEYVNLTPPPGC